MSLPIIEFFIDLDDTSFDTNAAMRQIFKEAGVHVPDDMPWIVMSDYGEFGEKVLREARFMSMARARKGWTALPTWIEHVRRTYGSRVEVRFSFLTHRGYHPSAEAMTKTALKRDGLHHIRLRCICPNKYPSKCKWIALNTAHRVHSVLVDDFNKLSQLPSTPWVTAIVADQPWNQQIERYPRFKTFVEFTTVAEGVIRNLIGR